jgi:hypothetical protein
MIICQIAAELREALYAICMQLGPKDGTAGYCRYLTVLERENDKRREAVEKLRAHYATCTICTPATGER